MGESGNEVAVADRDAIWTRDGIPVEQLPDPLAPETTPPAPPAEQASSEPRKRPAWVLALYIFAGVLALTLAWLIVTAPLSRALEPLDDPALP